MTNFKYIVMAAALLFAPGLFAEDAVPGIYLTPAIGALFFDDSRRLEDEPSLSIGIGYRFANPWSVELNYTAIDSKSEESGRNADVNYLNLGALYHLQSDSNLKPFFSFGLGETSVDSSANNDDYSVAHAGVGASYMLSANSALRSELRAYRGWGDDDNLDIGLSVGYQYSFGKAAPAPVVAPVDGDADRDGVADSKDLCANTPDGDEVDSNGCTADGDADGDGVSDSRDQCANTPVGKLVDANGCPDDDDGDGVRNKSDKCRATPAGVEVDVNGCGADTDMDGVPDHRDECAKTFPPALVDEEGCYVLIEEAVRITLDVEFDFDSAASRPEHVAKVKQVADFMKKYPLTNVVLEGHTDDRGDDAYNQNLSERRAATIGKMLVAQFNISTDRVATVGYGESRPVSSNSSSLGRQKNRRVVAEITAMEMVKKRQ